MTTQPAQSSYELVIEEAGPADTDTYRVYLLRDGVRIADTYAYTRWGARRWAKRVKRNDLREKRFFPKEAV